MKMRRAAATGPAVLLLASCAAAQPADPGATTRLPNPAAVFCEQQGGRYRTVQEAQGARGLCRLPDGREVDAWAYFRERGPSAPPPAGGGRTP